MEEIGPVGRSQILEGQDFRGCARGDHAAEHERGTAYGLYHLAGGLLVLPGAVFFFRTGASSCAFRPIVSKGDNRRCGIFVVCWRGLGPR